DGPAPPGRGGPPAGARRPAAPGGRAGRPRPGRMRIQRALARAGVTSRRDAERLVAEGRVRVNGAVAVVGQEVGPDDALEVDGRLVAEEEPRTYLLHKPLGAVSTVRDPQGRPTVLAGVPDDVRLYPVGRLDKDTTGALLVTNDGELASRLMHPRSKVP